MNMPIFLQISFQFKTPHTDRGAPCISTGKKSSQQKETSGVRCFSKFKAGHDTSDLTIKPNNTVELIEIIRGGNCKQQNQRTVKNNLIMKQINLASSQFDTGLLNYSVSGVACSIDLQPGLCLSTTSKFSINSNLYSA